MKKEYVFQCRVLSHFLYYLHLDLKCENYAVSKFFSQCLPKSHFHALLVDLFLKPDIKLKKKSETEIKRKQ